MPQLHFISGLRRSDSTLLAGILRQNSQYHASMSSTLFPYDEWCIKTNDRRGAFSAFFDQEKRKVFEVII